MIMVGILHQYDLRTIGYVACTWGWESIRAETRRKTRYNTSVPEGRQ